jgi:hypothetical protein
MTELPTTEGTAVPNPLEARRAEVAQYEKNIQVYTALAATLPTEYPAHLEKYRTATDRHAAAAEITNLDDVQLLADLWYGDDCRRLVRSEIVEMRKAKAILTMLEAEAGN